MKAHRHLVSSIVQALSSIFDEKYYADKVIERSFRHNRKWGARDRRFFAESVYDIVRWWRYLNALADQLKLPGEDKETRYWQVWSLWWLRKGHDLPQWDELPKLTIEDFKRVSKKNLPAAVSLSFPDWIYERVLEAFPQRGEQILEHLNESARVYLRVNTLKTDREKLQSDLAEEGIETMPADGCTTALVLEKRENVFRTECFQKGYFEVQDISSQHVAPLLSVQPGMRVIDACAGAGGKALHLAALMKNKGKIIAMDIHEWKLKELRKRASRAGVDIIETRLIDSNKVIKRLKESADALLLDVPCSGLGVVRRNPDTKWKLNPGEIERMTELQSDLLHRYSEVVQAKGRLVYATCSFLPDENEHQVKKFIDSSSWQLERELKIDPDSGDFDGFYGASLIK